MLQVTKHAQCRMQQRGYRSKDLEMIIALGRTQPDGSVILTPRDAGLLIAQHKREIEQIQRLVGSRVAIADDKILTVYHMSKRRGRLEAKRGREKDA